MEKKATITSTYEKELSGQKSEKWEPSPTSYEWREGQNPISEKKKETFQLESPLGENRWNESWTTMDPSGRSSYIEALKLSPEVNPTELPGAKVSEWRVISEPLPVSLPPAPPGYKTVQYEREIEIDLSQLSLEPPLFTPVVCEVKEVAPVKPEIFVETTAEPGIKFDTKVVEIEGGEKFKSKGPHGEHVTTEVIHLPEGGNRIETKLHAPLSPGTPEKIHTKTIIRDQSGETVVHSESKIVNPPSPEVEGPYHHHTTGHMQKEEGKKSIIGHHHHDTSMGGLLKGAFGLNRGENVPKETL